MSNTALHLLSQDAKAAGFHQNVSPTSRAVEFITNSQVLSLDPTEPLYYFVEQNDAEKYASGLDTNEPKTKGLESTLDIDMHYVVKSLLFYDTKSRKPFCILMHGNYTVNTRAASKVLKTKQVALLSTEEANAASGYIVGGTSGLGLKTPMPIILQESILNLDWIIINGGGHYRYLVIRPLNLRRILESAYAIETGFIPHVALIGKPRPRMFVCDQNNVAEDTISPVTDETNIPISILTATATSTLSQKFLSPPTQTSKNLLLLTETDQLKSIQNELIVLCNAFESNNLSNQLILLNDAPREHLLLFQPTPYPLKLLNHTGPIEAFLLAQQVPFEITHYTSLSVPIFAPSSSTPLSPTPKADIQTILFKFECTIPRGYPHLPLHQLKLSAYNTSDFYSLFDVDNFLSNLEQLATNAAMIQECAVLQCIEYISENFKNFFRQNLASQLKSQKFQLNSLTPSLSILSSLQLTGTLHNLTDTNISGIPQPIPILTSRTAPLSHSTTPNTIYSSKPIISQQYKASIIDPIEFCASNDITTIHPFNIYKYFLNGTFPLSVLDGDLTPDQRLAIYHTSLMGRIVKSDSRARLNEEIIQDTNKLKDRLGSNNVIIPEYVSSPLTTTHLHSGDSLADIIRKAYSPLVFPKAGIPLTFVKDTQHILQPSSDLKQVNVAQGETAQFIQKKRGNIKVGLVGLPNVGKSSLYNLLCSLSVPASNYAFCTIDPNLCKLPIVDERFQNIVHHTKKSFTRGLGVNEKLPIVPPELSVVDIAGIVKNACVGKGLGNAFLHHISTVHVIYQVIRCFDDTNTMDNTIEHVENSVNPMRDIEIINQELIEKDVEQFYRRIARMQPPGKIDRWGSPQLMEEKDFQLGVLLKAHTWLLETNRALRFCTWNEQEAQFLATLQTWTSKPVCYILNMSIYQYCDPLLRDKFMTTLTDYFFEQGFTDTLCIPISIVYEQARLLYQKRFVPLMGCDYEDIGIDYHDSSINKITIDTTNTAQNDQNFDHNTVVDFSSTPHYEMLCISALGREIQANRLNFYTSTQQVTPVASSSSSSSSISFLVTSSTSKDKKHDKHDKKDKKDKKGDKGHKKDKKGDKKEKFASIDAFSSDFAGGFSDFLGPSSSPEIASKSSPKLSHKKDKIQIQPNTPLSPHASPVLSIESNPEVPFLSLVTEKMSGNDYFTTNPSHQTEEQHQSTIFWTQVGSFLQKTPRLHQILKHIVRCDENNEPINAPIKINRTTITHTNTSSLVDDGDNNDVDHNIDFDNIDEDGDMIPNLIEIDQNAAPAAPNEFGDENLISNQVKGKILFINYDNPTPLASLIISACNLARLIQFYMTSSEYIKGTMIPAYVTTSHNAAMRASLDMYNNFHSVEVIHYGDFIKASYSLAKCREMGFIITHNKNYIIQDGDILNFKRLKQTKTVKDDDEDVKKSSNIKGKK